MWPPVAWPLGGEKEISEGYEAGCFDYVVKPIQTSKLLAVCRHTANQHDKLLNYKKKMSKPKAVAFEAMESGNQLAGIITLSEKSNKIKTLEDLAEEVLIDLREVLLVDDAGFKASSAE